MVNAWRTDSVLAIITESGPAAASSPLVEAILSREAVGGGNESKGHGDGSRRSLESPASDWKPSAYSVSVRLCYFDLSTKLYLCLNLLQIRPCLRLWIAQTTSITFKS